MSEMPPLPVYQVPAENNQAPINFATIELAGVPTTAIEIAIQEPGEARPLTVWTAYPGPNTPATRGTYFVFARTTTNPKYAVCAGKLIVF